MLKYDIKYYNYNLFCSEKDYCSSFEQVNYWYEKEKNILYTSYIVSVKIIKNV
jgi:hypothetical protein